MDERPTRSAVHDDSGTVLADPDPLVPLTAEQEERLRRAFEGAAAAPEESAEPLLTAADLLGVLNATGGGFRLSQEVLAAWLGRDEHLPAFRKKSFALDEVRAIAAKINADSSGYGSRMRLCAGRSHLRKLREYYERGCGLNTADATGRTALHVAAELEERAATKGATVELPLQRMQVSWWQGAGRSGAQAASTSRTSRSKARK